MNCYHKTNSKFAVTIKFMKYKSCYYWTDCTEVNVWHPMTTVQP